MVTIEYGYVALKIAGKRIDEHRLVWIQHNGPIPPGHIIHHKDGNKKNNDISNLECITRAAHASLHNTGRKLKPEHKAKLLMYSMAQAETQRNLYPPGFKKCSGCKQVIAKDQFSKNKSNSDGLQCHCNSCRSANRKKTGKWYAKVS